MEEYHSKVVGYTVEEARKGRTPNPDIMCNSRVKFGVFMDEISKRDFDVVASGHYAQVEEGGRLKRGVDDVKDQSYFLCGLTKEVLKGVQFPVGGLEKVRTSRESKQSPYNKSTNFSLLATMSAERGQETCSEVRPPE